MPAFLLAVLAENFRGIILIKRNALLLSGLIGARSSMILWYALLYPIVLSFDAYLYRKILCLLLFTCIWFVLIQEAYYLAKVLSRYLKFNCLFPVTL